MKGKVSLPTVLPIIQQAFSDEVEIYSFSPMKSGMTNDSYLLKCNEGHFIVRMPGKGSEELINRHHEYEVYKLIENKQLADEVLYFDPNTGVMIKRFIPSARVCNPKNQEDLVRFIKILKKFHSMRLRVDHFFDPWERLNYYESLWEGKESAYSNYFEIKEQIRDIFLWTQEQPRDIILSHIDSVADNILFDDEGNTYLIDWEYAAMQDKDIDVAMFAVYSLLNKKEIDHLIDIYQEGNRDLLQRKKIYAYVAIMGLVWSNWSEFQLMQGQDLGEYALGQFRFAENFSRFFYEFDEVSAQ
jgi:thiamine kinase-like enzyme